MPETDLQRAYRRAIEWIADNDNAGSFRTADDLRTFLSVQLVADVLAFGNVSRVAADVMECIESNQIA